MASNIGLIDLVPEYPHKDDPKLAAKLLGLAEFAELQQPFGKVTNLYNHQETIIRYFSPLTGNDRGLIMPDPGLGKTPIGVNLAEQGKDRDKKALVFAQNRTMLDNFKTNIYRFTEDIYINPSIFHLAGKSEEEQKRDRRDKLSDFYEFRTYSKFGNLLLEEFRSKGRFTQEFLNKFNGRTIVLDESHHIRATRQGKKTERGVISDSELAKVCGGIDKVGWMKGIRESYRAYFLWLHSIQFCRIFFLTATPAVDKKIEFAFQMNLLLPPERLFIAPNSLFTEFNDMKEEDLLRLVYEKCRGMISYARSKYPAKRIDKGVTIGKQTLLDGTVIEFNTRYTPCVMSEEQYEVVKEIESQEIVNERKQSLLIPDSFEAHEDKENSFRHKSRAASCFVFPYNKQYLVGNDFIGKKKRPVILVAESDSESESDTDSDEEEGKRRKRKPKSKVKAKAKSKSKTAQTTVFSYYIAKSPNNTWALRDVQDPKQRRDVENLRTTMRDLETEDGLMKLSSKYHQIIQMFKEDKVGLVTYIYSPLLSGSGLLTLMVCLAENGYPQFILPANRSIEQIIALLKAENQKTRSVGKEPARRIILISSESTTSSLEFDLLKGILNHRDNANGELIYSVLGSPNSGESISFHTVRRCIIVSPTWNESITIQVEGRTFRIDGFTMFAPEDAFVEFYHLAATEPPSHKGMIPTDIYIWMLAETKGRNIASVLRPAKQCSFDGMINKELNQRPGEIGGTPATDYNTSTYPIISGDLELLQDDKFKSIQPYDVTYKNRELYYDTNYVRATESILQYFRSKTFASFEELQSKLHLTKEALLFCLDTLVAKQEFLQDVHGNRHYLKEANNIYFLQPVYQRADPLLEFYSRNKYLELKQDISFHIEEAAGGLISQFVKDINANSDEVDSLFTSFYTIARENIAILFEGWMLGKYKLNATAEEGVIKRIKTNIGILEYVNGTKKLYHRFYYTGEKLKSIETAYGKGAEYKTALQLNKLNKTISQSKMRVYDEKTDSWRYATYREDEAIVEELNAEAEAYKQRHKKDLVYGNFYVIDGTLHLAFPQKEKGRKTKSTPKGGEGRDDNRHKLRIGKQAKTEFKTVLANVMWDLAHYRDPNHPTFYLDYHPDYDNTPMDAAKRHTYIRDLRETKRNYSEKISGVKLDTLEDEHLDFLHWVFVGKRLTIKGANPAKYATNMAGLVEQRLYDLDLIVEK
jgi:hypothetical protein